jgi:hypothetical protein
MKKIKRRSKSPLQKREGRGFRGYPVATIAFYGPTDTRATKVAVGIVRTEGADPEVMERWYSEDEDVRYSAAIGKEILAFIEKHRVKSSVMTDRIVGCPHEEGIDYPEGEVCPKCPFWAGRDRWTGEYIH